MPSWSGRRLHMFIGRFAWHAHLPPPHTHTVNAPLAGTATLDVSHLLSGELAAWRPVETTVQLLSRAGDAKKGTLRVRLQPKRRPTTIVPTTSAVRIRVSRGMGWGAGAVMLVEKGDGEAERRRPPRAPCGSALSAFPPPPHDFVMAFLRTRRLQPPLFRGRKVGLEDAWDPDAKPARPPPPPPPPKIGSHAAGAAAYEEKQAASGATAPQRLVAGRRMSMAAKRMLTGGVADTPDGVRARRLPCH
jgi:hypothetical protein